MATSGTFSVSDFDITNIIEEAYERIGTELRTGYQLRSARRSLDILTKEWSNRGVNLWTIESDTESVSAGSNSFALESDQFDLLEASWRTGTGTSQQDRPMTRIGMREWQHITSKNQTGSPSEFFVLREDPPTVYIWPVPTTAGTVYFHAMRHLENMGDYTNTADIPPRFIPALISGLTYMLALKDPNAMQNIELYKADYEGQFMIAAQEDRERSSMWLVPKISR